MSKIATADAAWSSSALLADLRAGLTPKQPDKEILNLLAPSHPTRPLLKQCLPSTPVSEHLAACEQQQTQRGRRQRLECLTGESV